MNQKGFVNILVMVIVILIGTASYFAFVKKSEPIVEQPSLTPTPTNSATTPIPAPTDETVNGKTYRNDTYGFEFKYPVEFEVKEMSDEYWKFEFTTFSQKDKNIVGSINISYNSPHWPSLGQLSKNSLLSAIGIIRETLAAPPSPTSLGKIKIDDVFGEHKVMIFDSRGEIHKISFQNNKTKFEIGATWGNTSDMALSPEEQQHDYSRDKKIIIDAFHQIISTFKFIR